MANIIKMVIQLRRATTDEWIANKDVVPAAGEPCFDLELNTLKIGDGVKTYEQLDVIGGAKEVSISADGKSIVFADGVFKLAGFDAAAVGAQPRKTADGGIEWVVPTVDVDALNETVKDLKVDVKTIQDIVAPSGEGATPLLSRVETLEDKVDILNGNETVEGSVLKIVKDEINTFANQITDDGTVNTIKELFNYVANHGGEIETIVADIADLQVRVGDESVSDQIASAIAKSGHITKTEAESTLLSKVEAAATLQHVKYEVYSKPAGTLVDYRDKEIRVMCPADTQWAKQSVGATGNANMYYMGFRAYAPEGAVSFKEDDQEIIADQTMYYFENNDFAGVDKFGRKYSVVWLALASYDEASDSWTYFGTKSSSEKYIGWYYSVEWYDADGKKIDSDCIRINLSNEACHNAIEPYYMANVVKEVAVNGTLLDVVGGRVDITIKDTLEVKASEEVTIAEDGTLGIGKISFSKIVQAEDEVLVLDGNGSY